MKQRLIQQMKWGIAASTLLLVTACGGGGSSTSSSGNDTGSSNNSTDTGTSNGDSNSSAFAQRDILRDVGASVAGVFQQVEQDMSRLQTSVNNYCATADSDATARGQAQADFRTLMQSFQQAALFNFGPAADTNRLAQVYSWPMASSCEVDLKLAKEELTLSTAVDRRGLDALEYLLFVEAASGHSCNDNFIVAHPELNTFNSLDSAEKQRRRCVLMQVVTDDAADNIRTISTAWQADGGNYQADLANARDSRLALNTLTNAMFYLEEMVKENKLDLPLGGTLTNTIPSCGAGQVCPQDVEAAYARISKENLIANMQGLQKLFFAGEPSAAANQVGFDDWLEDVGRADLATSMAEKMASTITALQALDGSLHDNLSTNPTAVSDVLNNHVQVLSQDMRFQFTQALGLELPEGSASDTD